MASESFEQLQDPHSEVRQAITTLARAMVSDAANSERQTHHLQTVEAGARFHHQVVRNLISLRQNGQDFDTVFRYLDQVLNLYELIAALPYALQKNQSLTPAEKRTVGQAYIDQAPVNQTPKGFRQISTAVHSNIAATRNGLSAEFLAFCLFDQLGLQPQPSSPQEDVYHQTDLTCLCQDRSIPLQIKSAQVASNYPPFWISFDPQNAKYFKEIVVTLDTSRLFSPDTSLARQIFSREPQENDDITRFSLNFDQAVLNYHQGKSYEST